MTESSRTITNLTISARRPLDYLRVLWWDFFQPDRIDALWNPPSGLPQTETRRSLMTIQRWLVASLMWLPGLLAVLAFGFILSSPDERLWILVPMLPAWLAVMSWTGLLSLHDMEGPRGCFAGLFGWLHGLSMLLWIAFMMMGSIAAVSTGHSAAASIVIGAAMSSSAVAYGIYRAMIYPTFPPVTPLMLNRSLRSPYPLLHVKWYLFDWWTQVGILWITFIASVAIRSRGSAQSEPVTIVAAIVSIVAAYLLAAVTGRVMSEDGVGPLAAAARGLIFAALLAAYALMIWILFLGGWRVL